MITWCIPSKSNLRYLKPCIESIIQNQFYKNTNKIIVFIDEDKDYTLEWLKQVKHDNVSWIVNTEKQPKGIGFAYDEMFKQSTTDYVIAFHADMLLGPSADYYMLKLKTDNNIVCATRVEPPIHPKGQEKIVMNFGLWPEDIDLNKFNEFVLKNMDSKKITKSIFAPWLINKKQHLGHDPRFKSVFEDADLFRRFKLAGYDLIQSWEAMVYHLTCRGGQFAGATKEEDFQYKDIEWQYNNDYSAKEYIRKWGGFIKHSDTLEPIPNKKYDVGVHLLNTEGVVQYVADCEPFFNNIKLDCEAYLFDEAKSKLVSELTNDIIVTINVKKVSESLLQFYLGLADIIEFGTDDEQAMYEFNKAIVIKVNKKQVKNPEINLWKI